MSTTMIIKKELHVPVGAILDVADILVENELLSDIVGTDADEDVLILEVQYEKEQREVIHQIEDVIAEFQEEDGTDQEEDDDK